MESLFEQKPALILIDIQKAFEDIAYWGGHRNNPNAEQYASELLFIWRKHQLPVFHVRHCSANPRSPLHSSNPGNAFNELVEPLPGEPVVEKSVNSAFIGTDLQKRLNEKGIDSLVIVGLTTDHCVSTTTRMAGNLGYKTYLVHDATATFNKIGHDGNEYSAGVIHATALASLKDEFAQIVSTDSLKAMAPILN
ncbi:MAG: cysteine hydrolase family protein [Imperialibacter sp.]